MSLGARLAPLDLLRAIAVILVLFRHHFFTTGLARAGWVGVDLFFVLSGFLISGLLFSELQTHGQVRIGRFLVRRGLKIYPSFYVFLAISAASYPASLSGFAAEAAFVQNYAATLGLDRVWYHTWSLAVEEHFYLLLPLVIAFASLVGGLTLRSVLAAVVGVGVACVGLRAWSCVLYPPVAFASHYEATHLRLDSLSFGVLLGYLDQYHRQRLRAAVRRWRAPMVGASVVLLAPPFFIEIENPWLNVLGLTGLYSAFGLVLLLAVHALPAPRWIESSWPGREVLRIGRDSYNIYLWHVFVLEVLAPMWRTRTAGWPLIGTARGDWVLYAFASIAVGHVATYTIERPLLKLRDRLVPRRGVTTG